jgi:tetratricopeptide (TPR) repeat protein
MRIGPYEVLGELGRGGMGAVHRVRAPDGRELALKVLLRVDKGALARFEREKRLLASLGEAQGFVGLLDAGTAPEGAWLLMPLVPGGTLRKKLEAGPLGVEETVSLGLRLAEALGAAHERGIVHRDVKPENVLFTREGRPLLADLGLAKHFDPTARGGSQSVQLTQTGAFAGTAGYTAPEQLGDAAAVGPPADVFALGAVLYECLAGLPAFKGNTVLEVLDRLSSGIVEPIGRPDVPPWLEGIVQRALALDPLGRFPDGASLARTLRSAREASLAPRRSSLALVLVGAGLGAVVLASVQALLGGTKPSASPPVAPVQARPAQELLESARKRNQARDWDGVIADTTRAIELDPGLAEALALRGMARGEKSDWDGETADATRAIELDPALPSAWFGRGAARWGKGDLDEAIADFTKALELDPGFARPWRGRGVARNKKGDVDGAIADYTKAIELDPSYAPAWDYRAAAKCRKGDFQGAIADDTKALELDPKRANAWYNRSGARFRMGDWDGVIADTTKAIELDPNLATAWHSRGGARHRKGDLDGAIADWTRAIELDPGLANAWYNRGLARERKGDLDGAIADLERFLELTPLDPAAPTIRQKLPELKAKRGR